MYGSGQSRSFCSASPLQATDRRLHLLLLEHRSCGANAAWLSSDATVVLFHRINDVFVTLLASQIHWPSLALMIVFGGFNLAVAYMLEHGNRGKGLNPCKIGRTLLRLTALLSGFADDPGMVFTAAGGHLLAVGHYLYRPPVSAYPTPPDRSKRTGLAGGRIRLHQPPHLAPSPLTTPSRFDLEKFGAVEKTRTSTRLPPQAPQACASTIPPRPHRGRQRPGYSG